MLVSVSLFAQERAKQQQQIDLSKSYIKTHIADWKLSATDIEDIVVENAYETKHNGVTHVYYQQRYKGIPIFNAIFNVNLLPNGEVFHVGNRFHTDIEKAVNGTQATVSPEDAILAAAKHLKIQTVASFANKTKEEDSFVFNNTKISANPIKVELLYQPMGDDQLILAWQLAIKMTNSVDYWNVRIDAQTGEFLEKNNWTRHCSFPGHNHKNGCGYLEKQHARPQNIVAPTSPSQPSQQQSNMENSSYNVFSIPLESPKQGNRSIVENPSDPIASPFGWHDTDGREGEEFTITRGNNVHAYADPDDRNFSDGMEPDGGAMLNFDFPFDPELEPLGNTDAAVTQLFYMNNVMHDFSYLYGFDEAAGNFQQNNYGNAGRPDDDVAAEALDNFNGSDADNASFSAPRDGENGRMNMLVWNRGGSRVLNLDQPEGIAGGLEVSRTSGWGGDITASNPITGQVANVNDGSNAPTFGCNPLENPEEVAGKIALIDRGTCTFVTKARNAQQAGAIAAIICNFENTRVGMADDGFGEDITIPVVMLTLGDCQKIRQNLEDVQLTFQIPPSDFVGPDQLDGSFDNGIIAHEYGHGISIRLTGGGTNVSCLINDEEMGEGWSDFFTLVTSVKPGDQGTDSRGIGNYVLRNDDDGGGIRRFPYSTDMSINNQTYKNVLATRAPHPLGEVWASALWDLYWAMSDKFGWDPDLYNGTGGNNMAIQLVMDGMKLQTCNPGFIDGRDAILAADIANNGGENQCLIWEVFARRGLGFSADQGSARSRHDIVEGFDPLPACIQTVKIEKTSTPVINAGEEFTVEIVVSNDKPETVTNLDITDELPEGTSLINSSITPDVLGSVIGFTIPELASGTSLTITYTVSTNPSLASISQFKDGAEDIELWISQDVDGTGIWELQDAIANSGESAWNVPNNDQDSEHILLLDEEIEVSGNLPVLRFFHLYDVEPGLDGGIVEISTDGGTVWTDLGPHFIRHDYSGPVDFTTFATPNIQSFWGNNENFEASYIDLSSFRGEVVLVRFRYGSPEPLPAPFIPLSDSYQGWFIDDVEFLDLLTYQGEACVTTSQGDNACTFATEGGTVVETGQLNTAVDNLEEEGLVFKVFPNPAGDYVNISLSSEAIEDGTISFFNMSGQQLLQKTVTLSNTPQNIPLNVSDLASGFYFVEVRTVSGVTMKKVILE